MFIGSWHQLYLKESEGDLLTLYFQGLDTILN